MAELQEMDFSQRTAAELEADWMNSLKAREFDLAERIHTAIRPDLQKNAVDLGFIQAVGVFNDVTVCDFLVRRFDADPNMKSWDGSSMLTLLLFDPSPKDFQEYKKVFQFLLDAGVDPNRATQDGMTALHYAVRNDHPHELIEKLLEKKADPLKANEDGISPLMVAVEKGKDESTISILISANADPNAKFPDGKALIQKAITNSHFDATKALLEHNADPDIIDEENGWTLLMKAVDGKLWEATETILESRADVNVRGKDGETAIHLAVKNHDFRTFQQLLQFKANVNERSPDGSYNIFHLAVAVGKFWAPLVEHDELDVEATTENGLTALEIAEDVEKAKESFPRLFAVGKDSAPWFELKKVVGILKAQKERSKAEQVEQEAEEHSEETKVKQDEEEEAKEAPTEEKSASPVDTQRKEEKAEEPKRDFLFYLKALIFTVGAVWIVDKLI